MRKHKQRMSTLLLVSGVLSAAIGGVIILSAFAQYEYKRGKFIDLGLYFVYAGLLMMLIRYLFISLPERWKIRKSGVVARRRELASTYRRPKPSEPILNREGNEEGSILIMALILLGFISVVAVQAVVSARAMHAESFAALETSRLKLAAIDAARTAMQQLADDPDLNVDHTGESWAEIQEYTDPAGIIRMTHIQDIQQYFDLNNLAVKTTGSVMPPADVLANVMILCGQYTPGQKIETLIDWMDDDPSGFYESPLYAGKIPSYQTPDRILYGPAELWHVDGWNAEMFERKSAVSLRQQLSANLVECVTVIPSARNRVIPLNINTAGATVLQGLFGFGREGLVERILNQRKVFPISSTDFLSDFMEQDELARIQSYLDVKSSYFLIKATTFLAGKSATLELIASRSSEGQVHAVSSCF